MPKKSIKTEQLKVDALEKKSQYQPNHAQQSKLAEFQQLFFEDREMRDDTVKRHFNERTLEQYLDDNQKRVNGYIEPRADADDWQTRYRSLLTRNKMLAILSKIATIRMKMKFKDRRGGGDMKKLRIFNAMYDHYEDIDNGDMKQFQAMWSAWQDGTVVDWIIPEKKTRKVKEIVSFDPETGDMETIDSVIRKWKVGSHILPLQDIWFGNIRETQEQEQPRIWLRFEPRFQEFQEDWGRFKNAQYVTETMGDAEIDEVFYREEQMDEGRVELLWYLNVWEDRMVIFANQIELYDGPMPYGDRDGKFYPLAVGWFEMISPDFVYGKSGADKLRGDQDLIDLFFRKLADRVIITSDPPILTENNPDLPEQLKLKPGRPIEVDKLDGIREFAFQDNSGEIVKAIQVFMDAAEQTSISSAGGGNAQPDRTATADLIAENATKQLVGLFQFFNDNFLLKRAMVKARHILQGINNPETIKAIVGNEGVESTEIDFGIFSERNVVLDDGSRGDRIYKIVSDASELPTTDELDMKEMVAAKQGFNVRYIYLTPDYFDGMLTEVEPEIGSSQEQSPALQKAMELEFQQGFATFYPELYQQNKLEFAKDYIEAYEKDVDRLLGQNTGGIPQQTGVDPENPSGIDTELGGQQNLINQQLGQMKPKAPSGGGNVSPELRRIAGV